MYDQHIDVDRDQHIYVDRIKTYDAAGSHCRTPLLAADYIFEDVYRRPTRQHDPAVFRNERVYNFVLFRICGENQIPK